MMRSVRFERKTAPPLLEREENEKENRLTNLKARAIQNQNGALLQTRALSERKTAPLHLEKAENEKENHLTSLQAQAIQNRREEVHPPLKKEANAEKNSPSRDHHHFHQAL